MSLSHEKRCPHYQMHSEPLEMDGPSAYLAVRRCLLTERMITLLRQSPEGVSFAEKLVVNATNGRKFAFVGPDLEAVTQSSCTIRRCEERCTPSYAQHLQTFGITDPQEDEVTCDEEDAKETMSETVARLTEKQETLPYFFASL